MGVKMAHRIKIEKSNKFFKNSSPTNSMCHKSRYLSIQRFDFLSLQKCPQLRQLRVLFFDASNGVNVQGLLEVYDTFKKKNGIKINCSSKIILELPKFCYYNLF